MLKLKKKYFLWQIKLFGNIVSLFLFFLIFLQFFSDFKHQISFNLIYFHVPLAYMSIYMYIYICIYIYIYNSIIYIYIYNTIIYILYVLMSGFLWGYLAFGKWIFFDIKIFFFSLVLITLLGIYNFFNTNYSNFFLILGLYFYLQSQFSVTWFNTIHQNFILEYVIQTKVSGKTNLEFFFLIIILLSLGLQHYIVLQSKR